MMKRTFVLLAALLFASATPALSQTPDNTLLLLQRVASQNGGKANVLVGKLPADVPTVPLPSATLLGSIGRTMERSSDDDATFDIFYDASAATTKSHEAALSSAGWTGQSLGGGGFAPSNGAGFTAYCKTNAPFITIWTGENPNELRVSVSAPREGDDALCNREARMPSPLPELRAPPGATMSLVGGNYSFDRGRSTARIHNGSSADALLGNFAAQMVDAGWHADQRATAGGIASQSFSKRDDTKARWQCVIVIDALDTKSGDFLAFIDAERVGGARSSP
jgi:hypothetical protein